MADMQAALVQRLIADAGVKSIADTRVYWVNVPQGKPLPYARLQVISDVIETIMDGEEPFHDTRVQVDAFAGDYSTARKLARALKAAMLKVDGLIAGVTFGGVLTVSGPRDLGEQDGTTFIHRTTMDFRIHHNGD